MIEEQPQKKSKTRKPIIGLAICVCWFVVAVIVCAVWLYDKSCLPLSLSDLTLILLAPLVCSIVPLTWLAVVLFQSYFDE